MTDEEKKELKEQRKELVGLLITGAKTISHGDKSVSYRSVEEIKQAITLIDNELAGKKTRVIKTYANRGI